jgi:hypothetical protein
LEGRGGVGESERHDQEFKVAMMRLERCFGDVLWMHQHLVVAAPKVELGEVACPLELVKKLVDDRDRKLVLHGLGVEVTVVDVESSCMIFLADEQDWCGER